MIPGEGEVKLCKMLQNLNLEVESRSEILIYSNDSDNIIMTMLDCAPIISSIWLLEVLT